MPLDGSKVFTIVTNRDFLAGLLASRFIKIRDAIYKKNS